MSKKHKPDYILLAVIFILLGFGIIALISATGLNFDLIKHQLIYGVLLGAISFFIVQKINYRFWQKINLYFFIISLFLLGLVFIPGLGIGNKGAQRWLQIANFSFQPGEIIKLSFIIFLASLFVKHTKFLPFIAWSALVGVFFIFQPDIGTLGLILIISLIIYFTAGAKIWKIILSILAGAGVLLVLIKLKSYRLNRFLVFLYPKIDTQGISYQINQAFIAFGSGGLWGRGLGSSQQKHFLPATSTDSIFAILGEELGFIGAGIIILLFIIFALRGFKIATRAPDQFGRLLATGITSWLVLQAYMNIMAITGLMPLTGMPLPFISYGASSMIVSLAGTGILFNISKYAS